MHLERISAAAAIIAGRALIGAKKRVSLSIRENKSPACQFFWPQNGPPHAPAVRTVAHSVVRGSPDPAHGPTAGRLLCAGLPTPHMAGRPSVGGFGGVRRPAPNRDCWLSRRKTRACKRSRAAVSSRRRSASARKLLCAAPSGNTPRPSSPCSAARRSPG